MRPRGQLWFELQRICQDFRDFSGLEQVEALDVLIAVLRNLLADTEEERDKLAGGGSEAPPVD
jgi:hypothetical protein